MSSPRSPTRDGEFYSPDIVFLVEGVLFKVPRRPFEHDSAFGDTFKLPAVDHPAGEEGTSDEHPLPLHGIEEAEFRAFLSVIFRPIYGSSRSLIKKDWMSVLKLSTMWLFDPIREQAIAELSRIIRDPIERIQVSRGFRIAGWIEPALLSLAQQDVLKSEELERLGWDDAARLFRVRESVVFQASCTCLCNYCSAAHGPVVQGHSPVGSRPSAISAATLRRSYEFGPKIREVFGTDLY